MMLNRKRSNKPGFGFSVLAQEEPVTPKYPNPTTLLIDIKDDTHDVLKDAGFNVSFGTFGVPYRVPKQDGYLPVVPNHEIPDCEEKEIIVVDLAPDNALDGPVGEKVVSEGENDWWAKCSRGFIDPRPRAMVGFMKTFDKILQYGGVFVIFAAPRIVQNIVWGRKEGYSFFDDKVIPFDNWSFLSVLSPDALGVEDDSGDEIRIDVLDSGLRRLFQRSLKGAEFRCNLNWSFFAKPNAPLATNKYGKSVASILLPNESRKGLLIILPQLKQKAEFILGLLTDVLPEVVPTLFPFMEGSKWVQRPEYEIPRILELKNQIEGIKIEVESKVHGLEKEIESERESYGFLHELIRGTDTNLVRAVEKTLNLLDFKKIVNVDEVKKAKAETSLDEDLWIDDASPLILAEVKGIGGIPADDEALQVQKYLAPRMKELNRTDIRGLSIINHQRNIPPLDRNNGDPFRKLILDNAQKQDIGLLTTWDLFRLARAFIRNNWTHEQVKDLFYQNGRILPVPNHYKLLGVVEQFWKGPNALSIELQNGNLRVGDKIAYELPVDYLEETVESLQIENQSVDNAGKGSVVGVKTNLTNDQAKKGVRVYLIQ